MVFGCLPWETEGKLHIGKTVVCKTLGLRRDSSNNLKSKLKGGENAFYLFKFCHYNFSLY